MSEPHKFIPLNIAVMTVSDTRTEENDKSGNKLKTMLEEDGHRLADKVIVPDDIYRIRAVVSNWIADNDIQVIITTGGTGLTGRDGTPEAVSPLLDKVIDGFGEMFRVLSYDIIGKRVVTESSARKAIGNRRSSSIPGCVVVAHGNLPVRICMN
ncbi:MAG: molybdopterin-binding protein [Candidatus Thiodiazotropha sp.]